MEHSITEEELNRYKRKIVDISKKLINNNVKDKLLRTLYKVIFHHGKKDEKSFYAKKILKQNFYIIDSDLYFLIKNYITAEQKEKILCFLAKNFNDIGFGILAIENMRKKEYEKAYEYFNKAEENRLNFPNRETYHLYKLIIKKMIDKNIKVICMQYPVRSVKSLQEQLKGEQYYNELTFISNEKIFKDVLMEKKYDEIFMDQFAGDFGHCTDLGNTIIAENIVKTLENILYLRGN